MGAVSTHPNQGKEGLAETVGATSTFGAENWLSRGPLDPGKYMTDQDLGYSVDLPGSGNCGSDRDRGFNMDLT
ncbi:hypothetical protein V6N13_048003 [Hibiscus sabdariffa]